MEELQILAQNRKPFYALTFVAISGIWATFIYVSTNAEKANSSVVNAVLFELRTNPISQAALGYPISAEKDDMFGQLWVDGQVRAYCRTLKRWQ